MGYTLGLVPAVLEIATQRKAIHDVVRRSSILSNDEIRKCVEDAIAEIPGLDITECQNARCTRMGWRCIGWHCPKCGKPCSSQGHECDD